MSEHLRVGDAERANAVNQLEQQAAAGRLSDGELRHRREQAQTAVYDVDLDALFADLPGGLQPLATAFEPLPAASSGVTDGAFPHQEVATRPVARPAPSARQVAEARNRAFEGAGLVSLVGYGLATLLFVMHQGYWGMIVAVLTTFVLFPVLALVLAWRHRP